MFGQRDKHGHIRHSSHDVEVHLSMIPWMLVAIITMAEVAVVIMAAVAAFGLDSWIVLPPQVFSILVLSLAALSGFAYIVTAFSYLQPREGYAWLLLAKTSVWLFLTLVVTLWYYAYGGDGASVPGAPSTIRWVGVLSSIWTLGILSTVLYIVPVSIQMFKIEMSRRLTHELRHR